MGFSAGQNAMLYYSFHVTIVLATCIGRSLLAKIIFSSVSSTFFFKTSVQMSSAISQTVGALRTKEQETASQNPSMQSRTCGPDGAKSSKGGDLLHDMRHRARAQSFQVLTMYQPRVISRPGSKSGRARCKEPVD